MENYEAGTDQNQGVVGTMARNQQHEDTELVGSRVGRLDPNNVTDQSGGTVNDEDAVEETDEMGEREYVNDEDEVVDEEGSPTGEHDHHQDDNYLLGGSTARTSA
ncbi:hypothetical protein ACAW74_22425 [Fibrella sp. WM1]|uniref:hypothetical protein n=1 Tax=Fibrella musci TaxID=3242485 RepID=UPI003520E312